MAPELRIVIVLAGCAMVQPAALAQTPAGSFMYTCVFNGKVYTADRPPD